jgi:hypothetical protein
LTNKVEQGGLLGIAMLLFPAGISLVTTGNNLGGGILLVAGIVVIIVREIRK